MEVNDTLKEALGKNFARYTVKGIEDEKGLTVFSSDREIYFVTRRLVEIVGLNNPDRKKQIDVLAGIPSERIHWGPNKPICIHAKYVDLFYDYMLNYFPAENKEELREKITLVKETIESVIIPSCIRSDNSGNNEKEPRSDRGWAIGSEPKASNNIDTSIMPQEGISLQGLFEQDLADQNAVVDNVLKCVYATKYKFSKRSLEYFIRRLEMELKYIYRYD